MQTEIGYLQQLLEGLTTTDSGKYLISRASAALALEEDALADFGNGLSFDEMLDLVLVKYQYDSADLRFAVTDQVGTHVPLDVAVGSWLRWAAGGSDKAALLVSNLAIAGLMSLFETGLANSGSA